MSTSNSHVLVPPVSSWGRKPLFYVRYGDRTGTAVIKRARRFTPGQKVEFCPVIELRHLRNTDARPPWREAIVHEVGEVGLSLCPA